jgi:predicted TIM-barrel fold metal-dependent hydrolase
MAKVFLGHDTRFWSKRAGWAMSGSGIIDIHTHIFPDHLAERAVRQLAGRSGETAFLDGTARALTASMARCGIAVSVTQPVSTKAEQTESINRFCCDLAVPGLVNFGTLHPDCPDPDAEIGRLKKAGIKGVKFHPDYQEFFVDEDRVLPLYRKIADAGLMALIHAGVDIGLPPPVHCPPDRLARVLDAVPDLVVIAAHFGGFRMWDEVERHLIGRTLYLDTSFTLAFLPADRFVRMARAHGIGKVLFGTDSPWADQAAEVGLMNACGLAEPELAGVFRDNAARLLGLA